MSRHPEDDPLGLLAHSGLELEELDADGALRESADGLPTGSRAEFLRWAAGGAASGLLLAPHGAGAQKRKRGPAKSDVAILNFALVLEYLQASFYTEAERQGALKGALARQARVVGSHERAHVDGFRTELGRAAVRRPTFDFRGVTERPEDFRRTAVAFEDVSVAAYKGQAPKIRSRGYLATALAVHSVEARHAAWIRRLAGSVPAPDAFDQPLPKARVNRLVASTRFITSQPGTRGRRSPRFTG